jgi:hypothetical protein
VPSSQDSPYELPTRLAHIAIRVIKAGDQDRPDVDERPTPKADVTVTTTKEPGDLELPTRLAEISIICEDVPPQWLANS